MKEWTHFDAQGNAHMVDISDKAVTKRVAVAQGQIVLNQTAYDGVVQGSMRKGDVLGVARVAGIMAAKRTSELIPMCHPLFLSKVSIDFETDAASCTITVKATAQTEGKTGVEMEALTAVQICLLTIYDMCKAVDRGMVMQQVCLLEKDGGASGHFVHDTGATT